MLTVKRMSHYMACILMSPRLWRAIIDRVLVGFTVLFILMLAQETIERTHVIDAFAYAMAELINQIKIGRFKL